MSRTGWCFPLAAAGRRLFPFIERIFADGGHAGRKMALTVWRTGAWKLQIVKRSDAAGFEALPKRWIVERTFAWISRNRRLARDFERYATTVVAFIRLAMNRIMLRPLLRTPRHELNPRPTAKEKGLQRAAALSRQKQEVSPDPGFSWRIGGSNACRSETQTSSERQPCRQRKARERAKVGSCEASKIAVGAKLLSNNFSDTPCGFSQRQQQRDCCDEPQIEPAHWQSDPVRASNTGCSGGITEVWK